jgi:lambda repressor-like predicted transcriptional regulator
MVLLSYLDTDLPASCVTGALTGLAWQPSGVLSIITIIERQPQVTWPGRFAVPDEGKMNRECRRVYLAL